MEAKSQTKHNDPAPVQAPADGHLAEPSEPQLSSSPGKFAPRNILQMQRTVGNQAVQRIIASRKAKSTATPHRPAPVQRAPIQRFTIQRATPQFKTGTGDAQYLTRAADFERRLGVYSFGHANALAAARAGVTKMRDVMVGTKPADDAGGKQWQNAVAGLFGRDDSHGAGQIGQEFAPVWDVLTSGNLREMMTAFYNAAYGGFKQSMLDGINAAVKSGDWSGLQSKGLNVDELQERNTLRGGKGNLNELYLNASDPRHRGGLTKFWKSAMFWQPFSRTAPNYKKTSDRTNADLGGGYENAMGQTIPGAGLSDREKQMQFNNPTTIKPTESGNLGKFKQGATDPKRDEATDKLLWKEGSNVYGPNMKGLKGSWMQKAVEQLRMPVSTGPSGTTDRMLDAWRFLNAGVAHVDFRLALLGWMLTSNDHSFHEIMSVASQKGMGMPYNPGPQAYLDIPPLKETELRQNVAPGGLFPHEAGYYEQIKGGKYETLPHSIAQQGKADLAGVDPEDLPGRENLTKATHTALYYYTGGGYKLQNAVLELPTLNKLTGGKISRSRLDSFLRWLHKDATAGTPDKDEVQAKVKNPKIVVKQYEGELGDLYPLAADYVSGKIKIEEVVRQTKEHNEMTVQALDKLKPYQGLVYRGTTVSKFLKKGGSISSAGFYSTSKNLDVAKGFAEDTKPNMVMQTAILEIDSRTGRYIDPVSKYGGEEEVLFKPGIKFTVSGIRPKTETSTGFPHVLLVEGGGGSLDQEQFEKTGEKPKVNDSQRPYFMLKLMMKGRTFSRGEVKAQEAMKLLYAGGFAHAWISVEIDDPANAFDRFNELDKSEDGKRVVAAMEPQTKQALSTAGTTTMGFYHTGVQEPEFDEYIGKERIAKSYIVDGVNQMVNFLNYIKSMRHKTTNKLFRNCTHFALGAIRAAGYTPPDAKNALGLTTPTQMYTQLYQAAELGDKSVEYSDLTPKTSSAGMQYDQRHLGTADQAKLDKLKKRKQKEAELMGPESKPVPVVTAGTVFGLDKSKLSSKLAYVFKLCIVHGKYMKFTLATDLFTPIDRVKEQEKISITNDSGYAMVLKGYQIRDALATAKMDPSSIPPKETGPKAGTRYTLNLMGIDRDKANAIGMTLMHFLSKDMTSIAITLKSDIAKSPDELTSADKIALVSDNGTEKQINGDLFKVIIDSGAKITSAASSGPSAVPMVVPAGTTYSMEVGDMLMLDDKDLKLLQPLVKSFTSSLTFTLVDGLPKVLGSMDDGDKIKVKSETGESTINGAILKKAAHVSTPKAKEDGGSGSGGSPSPTVVTAPTGPLQYVLDVSGLDPTQKGDLWTNFLPDHGKDLIPITIPVTSQPIPDSGMVTVLASDGMKIPINAALLKSIGKPVSAPVTSPSTGPTNPLTNSAKSSGSVKSGPVGKHDDEDLVEHESLSGGLAPVKAVTSEPVVVKKDMTYVLHVGSLPQAQQTEVWQSFPSDWGNDEITITVPASSQPLKKGTHVPIIDSEGVKFSYDVDMILKCGKAVTT